MIPMTGGGFLMPASHNFTIELQCKWIYIEIVTSLLSFFASNSHVVFNQVTFALYNKFDRTDKSITLTVIPLFLICRLIKI